MKKDRCTTLNCKGKEHCHGKCQACYQRLRYWNDRPLKDKLDHMKRLDVRANTMAELTNVRPLKKRRTRYGS